MRRILLVLAALGVVLLIAGGVAWAVTEVGTDGPDRLIGTKGDDKLFGEAGNDVLLGRGGNDFLLGGLGRDEVYGLAGEDMLFGGPGRDWVSDLQGKDVLYGGGGNDIFISADGNRDELYCGAGWDRYDADKIDFVSSDCEKGSLPPIP